MIKQFTENSKNLNIWLPVIMVFMLSTVFLASIVFYFQLQSYSYAITLGSLLFSTIVSCGLYFYLKNTASFQSLITQQKVEINDQEEIYKTLLNTMNEAMIIIDTSGIILTANPAAVYLFGYSQEELIGNNVNILMPTKIAEQHNNYVSNAKLDGIKSVIGKVREIAAVKKDGSHFPMELSISEMMINGEIRYAGIIRDTSERRKLEAQYRHILESMNEALVVIDLKANIASINPAAAKLFGYQEKELVGKNVSILMPGDIAVNHDEYVKAATMGGNKTVIGATREIQAIKRNGELFPIELSISEINIDDQQCYAGVIRDVTERKMAEVVKEEFLAMITHDLRSPITAIYGSLCLATEGVFGELDPELTTLLKASRKNCDQLIRLINDILDLSKIESGNLELEKSTLNLASFLEEAIQNNKAYAKQFNVNIHLASNIPSITIEGDQDRLMQVMNNVLSNASKYSPEGEKIEISATKSKNNVTIMVQDKGPGIPKEFIDHLFEKYSQASSTQTKKIASTGLGLYISKLIIEQHQGTIACENAEKGGAIFSITLPILQSVNLN